MKITKKQEKALKKEMAKARAEGKPLDYNQIETILVLNKKNKVIDCRGLHIPAF